MVTKVQVVRVVLYYMLLYFVQYHVFALANGKPQINTEEMKLGMELERCDWNVLSIFSLSHTRRSHPFGANLLAFLFEKSIPFTVNTINNDELYQVFRNEYVKKRQTNFILLPDSIDFLIEIQRLFYRHSKGEFALLPQRSNWLLLSERGVPLSNQTTQDLVFDNVASVSITEDGIMEVQTLLWKQQRRRKWESVGLESLGAHCSIFPNKAKGLNGRTLTWVVSKFFYGLHLSNNSMGEPEYAGFFVDVAQELETMLNFTSVYYPSPGKSYFEHEMIDLENVLRNRSADLGLTYYSQDAAVQLEMSGFYPLIFDHIAAAYVYKEASTGAPTAVFGLYDGIVPWAAATFMCVLLFYQTISYISRCIMKEEELCNDNQCRLDGDSKSKDSMVGVNKMGQNSKNRISFFSFKKYNVTGNVNLNKYIPCFTTRLACVEMKKQSIDHRILRRVYHVYQRIPEFHAFAFLGSMFGQSTMIRPKHLSLRIFIFFWCLFVIICSSLLTGTLTAVFINPSIGPRFTEVYQALQSDDVECGSFQMTEIYNKSKAWTIDGKQWTGELHRFPYEFNASPIEFRQFMEQSSNKQKVFIYYRNLLVYFKEQSNFKDLYITEDTYQQAPLGFVAPIGSELGELITPALIELHENGLLNKLIKTYMTSKQHPNSELSNVKTKTLHTELENFKNIFATVSMCLGFCVLILGIEFVAKYAASYS